MEVWISLGGFVGLLGPEEPELLSEQRASGKECFSTSRDQITGTDKS